MVLGNIGTIAACESWNNVFVMSYGLPAAEGMAVNLVVNLDWRDLVLISASLIDSLLMTSEESAS